MNGTSLVCIFWAECANTGQKLARLTFNVPDEPGLLNVASGAPPDVGVTGPSTARLREHHSARAMPPRLLRTDVGGEMTDHAPPLVWGAGMTLLAELADAVRAGRWTWIDQERHIMDFVHVDNVAAAAELALTRGRPNGVYYITDGTPMPTRDFMTQLFAALGADAKWAPSVPLGVAAPVATVLEGGARLLRRPKPPILTNW
jgi:nucleoside-diphosphate-sugar epimerase